MKSGHKSAALGVGATVLALLFTACAPGDSQQPRLARAPEPRETTSRAANPRPTPSTSPGFTPTPVEAPASARTADAVSPPPTPRAPSRPTLKERLLTAEQLPGFNDGFTWQATQTRGQEGKTPFGTCHKFAMTSIGAMRVVVRDFSPGDGPDSTTAGELVAEFPDPRTAMRAFEVLKSWRSQCGEELSGYDRRSVGELQHVEVEGGRGGWYMLTYGPAEGGSEDEGWFDSQGLTRVGRRIAVLRMRLVGQDFNYPAGQEPMVEAVRRAARRLG